MSGKWILANAETLNAESSDDGVKGAKNLFRKPGNTRIIQVRNGDKVIKRIDYGRIPGSKGKKILHSDSSSARHVPIKFRSIFKKRGR